MNRFAIVLSILVTITSASLPSSRILGGYDAVEGQFPYQISLQLNGTHGCGGSILNNRWILTASHCVYFFPIEPWSVVVGITNLSNTNARVYRIERIIQHEEFNIVTLHNDIALLRVSEDIEFNDYVQPIQLNTEDIGGGVDLILTGWGVTGFPEGERPDILQWIELTSFDRRICHLYHFWHHSVRDTQICTLTKKGEGFCIGDSGGPLVLNGRQVGIVSWMLPCGIGFPDVFTRVSSYINWINSHIN